MKIKIWRDWNPWLHEWEWQALVTGIPCGWWKMRSPDWRGLVDELCRVNWGKLKGIC